MTKLTKRTVDAADSGGADVVPRLGAIAAEALTREAVERLHGDMSDTPRQANNVLSVLSKMFAFAGIPAHLNPARGIDRYPERARQRFLSDAELGRLGAALDKAERQARLLPGIGAAVRLLALTGCRLGEVRQLTWAEVHLEAGVLRLSDSKTGPKPHVLGTAAVALLTSIKPTPATGWVFYGKNPAKPLSEDSVESAWKRLRVAAGLQGMRLHDLRHTVGTFAGQTGANAFLIRDKLGHKTVTMTSRYVNADAAPLRVLSDRVEARVANALAGITGEVVSMAKRRRRRRRAGSPKMPNRPAHLADDR
jgi:integrase